MRIMALDIGTKRVGVALSDELYLIAHSREVIQRTSDRAVISRLEEIVDECGVAEIVVGLPVRLDSTLGERARDSMRFAEKIKKYIKLPVKLWDERFSTKEAELVLLEASVTRRKRKKVIDKLAAQIILQGYLDRLNADK